MTAKIITIAQQKGGAGKTTLIVHLATFWSAQGLSVAVADIDPQGSVTQWAKLRAEKQGRAEAVANSGVQAVEAFPVGAQFRVGKGAVARLVEAADARHVRNRIAGDAEPLGCRCRAVAKGFGLPLRIVVLPGAERERGAEQRAHDVGPPLDALRDHAGEDVADVVRSDVAGFAGG